MFRRIIVAYDGSDRAQDALALALRLRDPEGGAVSDETALMLAAARAKLHGGAGKAIADACDGIVDLLVTGSRGYGPVQRALMGSVAEALLEGAAHPVLVLPRTAAGRISEHAHAGAEA